MLQDEIRIADARAWLEQALKDLRRVQILLSVTPPDLEGSLFHSQQAAEKALKGFLTWRDVRFRRVHDLGELGRQCAEADPALAELVQRATSLTEYAVRLRYPGARYQPSLAEAQAACELAREVVDAILARLPEEARP